MRVTGPLKKKISDNEPDDNKQQRQTPHATTSDNNADTEATQVLQVKLEALQGMLLVKNEMLRMKDEQLHQAEAREQFYQDELRAVRLLAAPQIDAGKKEALTNAAPKRKKWFFGIF